MTSPDQFDKKFSFSRNAKKSERIQFKNTSHGWLKKDDKFDLPQDVDDCLRRKSSCK